MEQEILWGMVARPIEICGQIVARNKVAFLRWSKTGEILYVATADSGIAQSTKGAVIGSNISDFLEKPALSHALDTLDYVIKNKKAFQHGFVMKHKGRLVNRIISLYPGPEKDRVCGFIRTLKSRKPEPIR